MLRQGCEPSVQHDGLYPQGACLTFSLQAALHQPCVEFCHGSSPPPSDG
jgi:hypothetical protein